MNSKLSLLLATFFTLTILPAWTTNVTGPPCSSDGGGGCDSSVATPTLESLKWGIKVGLARYAKPTTLTAFGQAAYELNGNLPDFKQLYGRYFSSSPLQQRQIHLELSQPQLSAATFHPSCLFLQSEAVFETLKKPAADGFPEFIHQILTDDAFTLIDVLPAPESGWHLRVWKRDAAALTKSGGFYVTTDFVDPAKATPLYDVVFKRPTGSSEYNTLIYIQKETTGLAGTRTITNEIVQTLSSNGEVREVDSKTYHGEGTAGPLLKEEMLTYTQRGEQQFVSGLYLGINRIWDYTIARRVYEASVDAAGGIGALTLTASTLENYDDYTPVYYDGEGNIYGDIGGESGMKRLMSLTTAYNEPGQTPQTSFYTYIEKPLVHTTHGRLQSTVRSDGSWTYFEYAMSASATAPIITEYTGWKDLTMADRAQARKTVTIITANQAQSETTIAGQLISQTRTTLSNSGDPVTTSEKWDGGTWHITRTAYYPDNAPAPSTGRIKWIENSDGTLAAYLYAIVDGQLVTTVSTGAGSREAVIAGLAERSTSGITAGTEVRTTFHAMRYKDQDGNDQYGIRDIPIAQITKDIASNLTIEQWSTDLSHNGGFDQLGRPIKRIYGIPEDNDYDISQYACCGLEFSRDRMGATTTYFRDGLKRVYKMETKASDASPVVATFITVDGLTTTQSRSIGGSDAVFLGSTTRSLDGLTRTTTGPTRKSTAGADRPVTTSVTTRSATGDTVTTTHADTSTSIAASYLDGRTRSTSGAAVPDMTYDYDTHNENGGGEKSIITASGVVTTEFTDLLGRPSKTVSGATGTTSYAYYLSGVAAGSRGKLASITDADNVTLTYGYNAEGERTTTSRIIPLAGNDTATQITTQNQDVISDITLHGMSLGVSRRSTQSISSTGVDPIIASVSYASIGGLISASSSFGSHTLNIVTRPDANGIATRTTIHPDGTRTAETHTHGLTTHVETQDASAAHNVITATDYGYDVRQRLETVTDSRTGAAGKTTYSNFTESGEPLTTTQGTTAPNIRATSVAKDILGRVIQTTLPDVSVTHTSYWPTGQIKARWGSQTNPVFHIYDEQNRPKELHTWQTAPALTQTTDAPPAGSAKTTWIYGSATGHLVEKNHSGETDDGITDPDYTYTNAGRLLKRTWERGITTTYGHTHGLMTSTDYSDGTPDVFITYDPLGRQKTVSNGRATSTFDYAADFGVDKEIITYADSDLGSFTRVLDRHDRSLGRDKGWNLNQVDSNGNITATDHTDTYGYSETTGRLETIANSADTFSYGYVPNSNLIETITATAGAVHTVTNVWEPTRDVLKTKQNKVGGTVVSSYDYTVNSLGQRDDVTTAFNLGGGLPANPGFTDWGYDSLGQVTSAAAPGTDADRAYQFDTIGNRIEARNGLTTVTGSANYTANALNQYTLAKGVTLPTTPAPAPYDLDGNLRFDGGVNKDSQPRECRWDAENRLIEVRDASGTPLVTYAYDALSRRIATIVGSGIFNFNATLQFYDGWNCIAEYQANLGNPTPALTRTRTWGMDLSGSMQGAGGVGGLLAEKQGANTYYPTYDGNGNISEYLAADGSTAAHFEYDAFGNSVVNTDSSNQFVYRFSTKPMDQITGLYYYGYRYYDPVTGRWPSRDPIEEQGGYNLYSMVWNDSVNRWDLLGLHCRDCAGEKKLVLSI